MEPLAELMGQCAAITSLREKVKTLLAPLGASGRSPSTLIQGGTGTGKGLLARAMHRASARASRPFVEVNCAAIPETLLEGELFGYERGAFTGAHQTKPGLLETAHGGTVFLDEVGLLPPLLQGKLLTVLEAGAVRRLGATRSQPLDIWVIAATNDDLAASIRERKFREDLYHRIAVITLTLPPLRERGDDVLLLAGALLRKLCADYGLPAKTLDVTARNAMKAYDWPGNVRELGNVLERAVLGSRSPTLTAASLGLERSPARPTEHTRTPAGEEALRLQVTEALERNNWNISRTAALLGIARNTLRAYKRKFNLRAPFESEDKPSRAGPPAAASEEAAVVTPSAEPISLRWERRRIAMVGVWLGAPGAPDQMSLEYSGLLKGVLDKVQSFGGHVESITGNSVEASFGIEPIEDAPRRAACAALAMRRELLAAGPATDAVAARIAIHTSEVAVAHAGERARIDGRSQRQLGALLDSLLTVTAPDTISATAAMQPFLRREFVVTRAPGSGGEELYQVLNYRRSGGAEGEKNTRFVGRQSDMAALEERLALALTGRGQVVAIIGDPGLGKSRLLAEFARSRPARAARFLETGSAYAAITPHLPVIELLRRFFGIEPADDTDTVRQRVAATLTSRHAGLASSRSALLALVGAPDQDWSGLDPIERRHRIHEAVKRLLIAESRIQPLVIVFEDVHWIDSESQALLDALVQALPAAPVLLLLTYRPRHVQPGAETTPREDPRHQWSERSHYTQWSLSPLSSASTAELLEDLLGNDPSLEPLKRRLEEWTDGNPFFLEECVQALLQTGVLQGRRGSYRATDGSPALAVPATVEDILAARIDGLVEDDKRLVQSAAVVGTDVPLAMLSAIVDWPADALREGMERLQAAELMYESHAAPAETFVFKHALTREVAYRGLEASERRRLHQKIAAALAAAPSEMGPEHLDRLARHAVQGELWQDAANYLRQAGNRAMRSAAVTEAAKYFGEALAALRQLPPSLEVLNESIHVRISLQDAFWPPLQFDRQFEVLKEAEKLAEKGADLRWRGWIACYLCRYFWAVGDNAQARLAGDRALEIARSVGNLALIAETNVYRGLVQDSAGEYREAVETLTAALRDLERAISESRSDFPLTRFASSGPVIVRSFLVRALAELGDFATAVMAGEEAMRLADASGSPFALVAAAGGLGAVHVRQRRPQQAIDVLEPALRATRMYRLRHWLPTVGGSLGAAYVACGRIDEGLPLLRECVEHGERFRLHAHASMWAIHLGHAYLRAGRRDQALSLAQDIVARCRQRQEQGNEASALRLLADVEATGDSADQAAAASRYEHVLALAREFGMRPLEAHCHHALGTLLVGLGRREQGTTLLAMAAEAYRALDMPEAA